MFIVFIILFILWVYYEMLEVFCRDL